MKITQENRITFGTPGDSITRDSLRGRSRKRIHMDWPLVRVWQLFNLELSLTLAVLLLIAPHLGAVPPSVTTSAATMITDSTAMLNGNLGAIGNGTVAGNVVTVRQFAHNRCTGTTCAATLALPTIRNDTIVVIVSSNGGSTTPTDDGANNYTGWNTLTDLSGRRLFQLDFAGVNEGPTLAALYGVTNPMQTVTAHSTGNPSGLFVAELSKSIPFHATMTQITNTPANVYGVSVNHTYGFILGDLMMNAVAGNCNSFAAYEGTKVDTYEGPFLAVECSYLMKNTTGTRLSITDSNGIRSGNVIQLLPAAASCGFLWGTSPTLVGAMNVTVETRMATGAFQKSISSLTGDTTYFFRAWAYSSSGFVTGSILSFTTLHGTSFYFNAFILFTFMAILTLAVVGAVWLRNRFA